MRFWNNLLRRASRKDNIFVPRLSTPDEITKMAIKRARKMAKASRKLPPAFTALEEDTAVVLDAEEELCCARTLSETGLSQNDYPAQVWEQIVMTLGVNAGFMEAAKARLRYGDYSGALGSWVKWVYTWDPGLPGRPVDYIAKEDWLLLTRVYIGLRCSSGALKALTWAKIAGDIEERRKDLPRRLWAHTKAVWESEIEEVRKEVHRLD